MSISKGIALVVDDEEDICHLITSYLRKRNYKAHYALSLKEGIKKCKTDLPDLIFLDNNLPDGAGIKAIPDFSGISPKSRIIVISAMSNLKEEALSAGAVAFVGKPISFQNIERYL